MYRFYKDYIKNHPLLTGIIKEERDYYLPCYRLAIRIKKKVEEEIKRHETSGNENKISTDWRDYIPLGKGRRVAKNVPVRLRELMEGASQEGLNEKGTFYFRSADKLIQRFWYQVRYYAYPDEGKSKPKPSSIEFLNVLCRFVGASGFEEFIQEEFHKKKGIRILLLPFWRQVIGEGGGLEDLMFFLLRELQQDKGLPLDLVAGELPLNMHGKKLTKTEIRVLGNEKLADVVFWCSIYEGKSAVLYTLILDPALGYYEDFWRMQFDLQDFNELGSPIRKKIKATIYWCLAIQYFLQKDYSFSSTYFKKILELEIDEVEVSFRMGVVFDLIDSKDNSRFRYLLMLDLAGVQEAAHFVRSEYGLPEEITESSDAQSTISVSGDYIEKEESISSSSSKNGLERLMYFEIVRIKLALTLKDKLPEDVFERALRKATHYARKEYLKPKYFTILGEAYYELARLNHKKMGREKDMDLIDFLNLYEQAALLTTSTTIHQACVDFFKKCGYLQEVREKIQKTHGDNSELLTLYES